MSTHSEYSATNPSSGEQILAWLATFRDHPGTIEQLRTLLHLPFINEFEGRTYRQLLDLIHTATQRHSEQLLRNLLPHPLPAPRPLRQTSRELSRLLGDLAQRYHELATHSTPPCPHSLWLALYACCQQLFIAQSSAAPAAPGTWAKAHEIVRLASRHGLDQLPGPQGSPSLSNLYLQAHLLAIAQPAALSPAELFFANQYIARCLPLPPLTETAATDPRATFWIDGERDSPAFAAARRPPPPDHPLRYFDCRQLASHVRDDLKQLGQHAPSRLDGLPRPASGLDLARILRRLADHWATPARRKFPRRRQSYRVHLCHGLEALRQLNSTPPQKQPSSEWMVINESPDGYALMHVNGEVGTLRIDELIGLQTQSPAGEASAAWQTCVIRRVLSDNPEHLEIGLEILSPRTLACTYHQATPEADNVPTRRFSGLYFPALAPLRPRPGLALPPAARSQLSEEAGVLIVEQHNLWVREVRLLASVEQSSCCSLFTLAPDDED